MELNKQNLLSSHHLNKLIPKTYIIKVKPYQSLNSQKKTNFRVLLHHQSQRIIMKKLIRHRLFNPKIRDTKYSKIF